MCHSADVFQWIRSEVQSLLEVDFSAILNLVGSNQIMLHPQWLFHSLKDCVLPPPLLFQSLVLFLWGHPMQSAYKSYPGVISGLYSPNWFPSGFATSASQFASLVPRKWKSSKLCSWGLLSLLVPSENPFTGFRLQTGLERQSAGRQEGGSPGGVQGHWWPRVASAFPSAQKVSTYTITPCLPCICTLCAHVAGCYSQLSCVIEQFLRAEPLIQCFIHAKTKLLF